MTVFWLGSAGLLLLALLFVGFPWLSARRGQGSVANNVQLTKERLKEIEQDEQEGLLSAADKQEAIIELKAALAVEEQSLASALTTSSSRSIPWVLGMALALGVIGYVYWQQQQLSKLELWQQANERLPELSRRVVVEADETVTPQELQLFGLGLRTKLKEKGDDAVGWLLLGRVYAANQRLDMALEAFGKALALDPEKSGTLLSYSQALVTIGDEASLKRAIPMLQRYLQVAPNDTGAVSMLAFAATELGQRELAIASWQQALSQLDPSAPFYARIQQELATLQGHGDPSTQGPEVLANIDVDQALLGAIPDQAVLFVFALDAEGNNPMPAAVVKQPLGALPATLSLSNANAMLPNYNLGQLQKVRLVARISADGSVDRGIGDLEGESLFDITNVDSPIEQTITITTEIKE